MKIREAVEHLKTNSQKRKFVQSFDLAVNLKNINTKKPENKFSKDVTLPHGRGRDVKVGVISDSYKDGIGKAYIEKLNPKEVRNLARNYDFFICEPQLMLVVGKVLGKFLGPKGKMPKIIPPNRSPDDMMNDVKKSVKIFLRESPTIHVIAGNENMDSAHVEENVRKIIEAIEKSLPKGKNQIKNIVLKLTMSKPVKIEW
jgi:large subunit ribosomal protein L1